MPVQNKKPRGCPNKKNNRLEASADVSHGQPTSSTEPPNLNAIVNMSGEWIENSIFEDKTLKSEKRSWELPARMAVDGTCAPPKMPPIDKSFQYSNKTPPSTPPKFSYARMTTGGRAPPKSPSPLKDSPSKLEETPRPTSTVVRTESETRMKAVKKLLVESKAVKRPRGRPKKVSKPGEYPEVLDKRPVGRPRKSLANGSQATTRRGRGRPKGSGKKLSNTPVVRKAQSGSLSPVVLMHRYVPKTASSKAATKSGKGASGKKAGAKQRGRPRKSVSESSSKKQLEKKSRASSSGKSSKSKGSKTSSQC